MFRLKRVASLIKSEIARIIRQDLHDDGIGFISITEVAVSKDIRHAWIYYSQIGTDEEKELTKQRLYKSRKFIKGKLGDVIEMKTVPDLHFKFDTSIERGVEIVSKINDLSN